VSLAKGLGGGIPIGAMLTTEALANSLPAGMHGTTFGGNPLACRAALTVLSILETEGLVEGAAAKGAFLDELLAGLVSRHPEVCESARGVGLLRGLVLKQGFTARDCLGLAMDAGVMLTAAGDRVLRFTPPLVVTEAELRTAVERVEQVVQTLEAKTRAA
jgi:acetylornithine/succinyldiaminopimelate/putrescine aminotransferase